ncbi:hypothetical protein [Pseudovibrio japonicus]|nr:hypothetical protein [Pseudovibrio japonicus]
MTDPDVWICGLEDDNFDFPIVLQPHGKAVQMANISWYRLQ